MIVMTALLAPEASEHDRFWCLVLLVLVFVDTIAWSLGLRGLLNLMHPVQWPGTFMTHHTARPGCTFGASEVERLVNSDRSPFLLSLSRRSLNIGDIPQNLFALIRTQAVPVGCNATTAALSRQLSYRIAKLVTQLTSSHPSSFSASSSSGIASSSTFFRFPPFFCAFSNFSRIREAGSRRHFSQNWC